MEFGSTEQSLIQLGAARFEPGYWRGMRQPAVQTTLLLTRLEVAAQAVRGFDALMVAVIAQPVLDSSRRLLDETVAQHPVLSRIMTLALAVLDTMGMPLLGGTSAVKPDPEGAPQQWLVGMPAVAASIRAPQAALGLACRVMNRFAANVQFSNKALEAEITNLVNGYRLLAPSGVNTLRFLNAAHELGIPWRHVAKNVYQFGWGSRSRWLDSSFTDETSTISANLARDKVASATVLRNAGLPVPRHQLVTSAEQAVAVAEAMGYPVVVKPANLDGGQGVFAGLGSANSVKRAYSDTAKLSQRILVEQFIAGDDHRLQVYKGEVFWVVRRRAAYVKGNGIASVTELVAQTNASRAAARSRNHDDPMLERGTENLVIDAEAEEWLESQGLDRHSVPADGQTVRLRGAANVSLGGTREGIRLDEVHPDNLALAAKAAAALRLDFAGIDLLLPDIRRSWRETGGGICEVNAQPQMSGHLQKKLLPTLVPYQGRIPVVCVCLPDTLEAADTLVAKIKDRYNSRQAVVRSIEDCIMSLADVSIDAVIWLVGIAQLPFYTTPIDRVDLLVLPRKPDSDALVSADKQTYGMQTGLFASRIHILDMDQPSDHYVSELALLVNSSLSAGLLHAKGE